MYNLSSSLLYYNIINKGFKTKHYQLGLWDKKWYFTQNFKQGIEISKYEEKYVLKNQTPDQGFCAEHISEDC